MKFVAIIPARYASSRFPGKPLAMLGGKYVIQRVYETVSSSLEDVYVTEPSLLKTVLSVTASESEDLFSVLVAVVSFKAVNGML